MHYDPASTPGMLLEEAKEWDRRHGGRRRVQGRSAAEIPARGLLI